MVALVLYGFATNVRASRAIERHCRQDVAYRVITGNLVPDHATIARFICRQSMRWRGYSARCCGCVSRAGLVKPGVVSIDGTRLDGNCSPDANCQFEQIAREILEQAKATDAAEDEVYGEVELHPALRVERAAGSCASTSTAWVYRAMAVGCSLPGGSSTTNAVLPSSRALLQLAALPG